MLLKENSIALSSQDDSNCQNQTSSIKLKSQAFGYKRFLDILFVSILIPIAIPLMLIACLLMKLTSKGSIFFSQIRIGKYGKEFVMYKIRTMTDGYQEYLQDQDKDSRITVLGKFLRVTKIDELPQLYNILKGDMSLIGPRPEQPRYVRKNQEENPLFNLRHVIKPGITGWAQIHIPKATPADNLKKLEYDLYYIKNYSWKLDLIILLRTVKVILTFDSH